MPAFDVFALSSVPRSEGVPTVILEAMGCALPGGRHRRRRRREVVEEGVTGFVVPPLGTAALADAIERLASRPAACASGSGRPAAGGRSSATTTSVTADTYARAYELAVRHRASRA